MKQADLRTTAVASISAPPSPEAGEISQLVGEERQRALRALLRFPLLLADNAEHREVFALVRRHAEALRTWFTRYPGWALDVTPECARLFKVPSDLRDATRPAVNATDGEPFTRRRYVLFCLSLAALVRADRQVSLGEIARALVAAWADEPEFAAAGLSFDLEQADARRDLVGVLRLLLALGALRRVDGEEQRFIQSREANVLYDVSHHVVFRLLASRKPPALVQETDFDARLAALTQEATITGDAQRGARVRAMLFRRLLDDPVVYPEGDLTPEERDYLATQRPHILAQIVRATGLKAEDRRDGLAVADPTGDCTDLGLPEQGTEGHATLLVAEHLGKIRLERPGADLVVAHVETFLAEKATANAKFWSKEYTAPGAHPVLARRVLDRLAALRLIAWTGPNAFVIMPAIHRYRHELRMVRGTNSITPT